MEDNKESREIIELFLQAIKNKVPAIKKIGYEYNRGLHTYFIWHDLEPNNEEKYSNEIGTLICDFLFANDIYDVSFAYNTEKAIELSQEESHSFFQLNQMIKLSIQDSIQTWLSKFNYDQIYVPIQNQEISFLQSSFRVADINTKILFDDLALTTEVDHQEEDGQEVLAA